MIESVNGRLIQEGNEGRAKTQTKISQVSCGKFTERVKEKVDPKMPQATKVSYAHKVQHGKKKVEAPRVLQRPGMNARLMGKARQQTRLQGARRVKTVPLYLMNIQINDETDDDIAKMVVEYTRTKGIKVSNTYVLRYKGCTDVVGCKIMVAEEYVTIALKMETWPEDITCRIWEKPEIWKEIRRNKMQKRLKDRAERETRSGTV